MKDEDNGARVLGWLSGLLLFLAVGVAAAQTCGCAASARQKTIASTLLAVDAACNGGRSYLHAKAEDIIKAATSEATGSAALDKLDAQRSKLLLDCDTAYRASAIAAQLDNEQSVASFVAVAGIVFEEIKALGLKIPGVSL